MQNSQKSKGRKPIFAKKQKNQDTDPEKLYQTTASFLLQSQTTPIQAYQTVQPTRTPSLNHSSSVNKTVIPMQIRVYSPTKIVNPQNSNLLVSRPLTPQTQQMPVYRQNPVIQHPIVSPPFYRTQPQFYQNPGLVKVSSKCIPRYQNPNINEKMIRTNELKPTVVAVERVMKPIGENKLPTESIFKPSHNTSYTQNIVEPERIKVYNQVQRKNGPYAQKIQKLQEINGMLSRNYDALLDEVQFLKQEQYGQEDVLDQNKFIRKAANLFQNLLNVEMHKALNEIEQVHKVEKRCVSNYRKSHTDSFFR